MMLKPLGGGEHTIVVHGTNIFGDDRRCTSHLSMDDESWRAERQCSSVRKRSEVWTLEGPMTRGSTAAPLNTGEFCWAGLATTDVPGALRFYGELGAAWSRGLVAGYLDLGADPVVADAGPAARQARPSGVDQARVIVDGDTAAVSAHSGERPKRYSRYVDVYERRADGWRCITACVWPLPRP